MYKAFSPNAIGFPLPFSEAVSAVAKNRFEGYWFDIKKDLEPGVAEVRRLLSSHSLKPAGFGLPVNFRGDEDGFRADLALLSGHAQNAEELGMERCTTWLMPASDTIPYEENFALHARRLKEICTVLKEHGIRLGLEFVGPATMRRGKRYEFVHNLTQTLDLIDEIGTGNAGLLMDAFHWQVAGQTDNDFERIPDAHAIVLVHVNDAPAGRTNDEQIDNDRRLPGETGVIAIGDFFAGITKLGYDGPVVVEPFSAKLKAMTFNDAVAATMAALTTVWPTGA